ncbi:MAG: capsule assembly Wzi family protein [Woeseiaceae bacterium]|nr:capsule assembly Wzi family protein [Woeseiaceae bacterium]
MSFRLLLVSLIAIVSTLAPQQSLAEVLAAPGDLRLRHDIELLNDSRAINISATAWPISWGEIQVALDGIDRTSLTLTQQQAVERLRKQSQEALEVRFVTLDIGASVASNPRFIRTFEDTPRDETQFSLGMSWVGERFTVNLQGTVVADPIDGDEFRPDGSYVGVALGNWMVTAGWQDRWWGPGRDGSLILGNNHRPAPGISLQRNNSTPFETKWLSWMGPWSVATFMQVLDDERAVEDALLFGLRGSIRPVRGLEIGLTRSAQWCGEDRPCDFGTFTDLLLGRDNAGVNVDPDEEPGNQLGGIDIRWSLPRNIPVATYMQWIGEDGRPGSGLIGSWMRQVGVEFWGTIGGLSHRTHFEVSDTLTREGGFGFSDKKPNTAYEHPIYASGYRYRGKVIGHGADSDSLSYSLGSTLVQSDGHVWNVSLRYMEINREGSPQPRHTISESPLDIVDAQVTHERHTRFGRFTIGAGYESREDPLTGLDESDTAFFIRWNSR